LPEETPLTEKVSAGYPDRQKMIVEARFKNFRVLRDATLKLGAFNLVVGPNGSGKSTAFKALSVLKSPTHFRFRDIKSAGIAASVVSVEVVWNPGKTPDAGGVYWFPNSEPKCLSLHGRKEIQSSAEVMEKMRAEFQGIKTYAFEPSRLAQFVDMRNIGELSEDGSNLAAALTLIRDRDEDAYNGLRDELRRWLPEFDSVGFATDPNGYRSVTLRQKKTAEQIPAAHLSQGTLLAVALLTVVYQASAPTLICLEEPDRGLHPRLLRDVRDSLYRLSYPAEFGLKRQPIQVIVSTHSPYFLDLFKDRPDEVIVAEKHADGTASFKKLSEDKELQEIIGDAPLGEVWYSGVLGGVPVLK
jgi:predicted ATPase